IQRQGLADLAFEAIMELIYDRRFSPGDRLGIEALAEEMGISATPVREALNRVASHGLVRQDGLRGFTVTPLLSEPEYHQLFQVRYLLELQAVKSADIDVSSVERMQEITVLTTAMDHGPGYRDFAEFNRSDRDFHRLLVGMAGNRFLTKAWEDLHFHLHVGRLYAGSGVIDYAEAVVEHTAIVDALQRGDQRRLLQAADRHITQAERRLRVLAAGP
ncbi:MAG: FCD domain-containing protein, partial [Chloroflexi bacterium]|nr:FCD domain-containing protein [Chloroflexota bacterium]